MNLNFQDQYSDTGNAMRPSPIIVVEDDYLVLDYNGSQTMEPFNTMVYHNLKMVGHIPLVRPIGPSPSPTHPLVDSTRAQRLPPLLSSVVCILAFTTACL